MGALGIAILSKKANKSKTKLDFNFDLKDISFKTIGRECNGCSNNCEIVDVYKDNEIIDSMGNRCQKGSKIEVIKNLYVDKIYIM